MWIKFIFLLFLVSCGDEYNNVTPLPTHNACSVAIPDYPNECFTCRGEVCQSDRTECLIQDNQWGCYAL